MRKGARDCAREEEEEVRKEGKWSLALVLAAVLLTVGACASPAPGDAVPTGGEQPNAGAEHEIKVTGSGVKYIVDPREIIGGGPPKDGIPSLDNPRYVTVAQADEWIADNELVLTLEHKGVTRVYPLQIMVWHEIVNDVVAGDPILITY